MRLFTKCCFTLSLMCLAACAAKVAPLQTTNEHFQIREEDEFARMYILNLPPGQITQAYSFNDTAWYVDRGGQLRLYSSKNTYKDRTIKQGTAFTLKKSKWLSMENHGTETIKLIGIEKKPLATQPSVNPDVVATPRKTTRIIIETPEFRIVKRKFVADDEDQNHRHPPTFTYHLTSGEGVFIKQGGSEYKAVFNEGATSILDTSQMHRFRNDSNEFIRFILFELK